MTFTVKRQSADISRLVLSPDGYSLVFSTKDPKTNASCLRVIATKGEGAPVLLTTEPQATLVPNSVVCRCAIYTLC